MSKSSSCLTGTTSVPLSGKIRVRDHDRTPCAPDIKRVLHEIASGGGWSSGLKPEASDAHRTIPIAGDRAFLYTLEEIPCLSLEETPS